MERLQLRNPHSVLAVLECRPQALTKVFMSKGQEKTLSQAWKTVLSEARSKRIPVVEQDMKPAFPGSASKGVQRAHSAYAEVQPREEAELETVLGLPDEGYGLWLALDSVQDPQNMGALFRSAAFFGVRGILLMEDRSAPLSSTAYDVAAGGLEYVPFVRVTNLTRALEKVKEHEIWILGTSEHAQENLFDLKFDRHWMIVLGNEESGLRRLVSETCDQLCKIPSTGGVGSLNVSSAGSTILGYFRSRG